MKFRLITVIWGQAFVDAFLKIGLRSLLAEGNIPAIGQAHQTVYTIFTTEDDAERIRNSSIFSDLNREVDVQFSLFSTNEINRAHFASHGILWERGVELARRNRETLFFLIPDIVYARGTLDRWATRFGEGYKAIYSPGPQVVLETVLPALEQMFPESDNSPISLSSEEIIRLGLIHLHPIATTMLRDSPYRIGHPEHDLRPVAGRGLVLRSLCSQPFAFDPSCFHKMRNFNPCDHLDRSSFEPCMTISVEPLMKHVGWYYRPWRLNGIRLTQMGAWWNNFGVEGCLEESKHCYDLCLNDDDQWRSGRRRAVAESRMFRQQLIASRTIYRLFVEAIRLECHEAARLIAAAAYLVPLRRLAARFTAGTILLPNDAAMQRVRGRELWRSLTDCRIADFMAEIAPHLIPPGKGAGEEGGAFEVVSGPHVCWPFVLHVVDRVMGDDFIEEPAGIDRNTNAVQGELDPSPSTEMGAMEMEADPRRGRAGILVRLVRRASSLAMRVLVYPVRGGRNISRRILLFIEPIPVLGRVSGVVTRAIRYWDVHGLRAVIRRALERILGENHARSSSSLRERVTRLRAYMRLFGLRSTITLIRKRIFVRGRKASGRKPDDGLEKMIGHLRQMRGLESTVNVLSHYEQKLAVDNIHSVPARFALSRLETVAPDVQSRAECIGRELQKIIKVSPDCAEAWLEYGYIQEDMGDIVAAREAWKKAEKGKPMVDLGKECRDPRAQAAAVRARSLMAIGESDLACAVFRNSLALQPDQRDVCAELGFALIQTGHPDEAASQFAMAMDYGFPTWCMPGTIRDAEMIDWANL